MDHQWLEMWGICKSCGGIVTCTSSNIEWDYLYVCTACGKHEDLGDMEDCTIAKPVRDLYKEVDIS